MSHETSHPRRPRPLGVLLLALAVCAASGAAAQDLSGIWEGQIIYAPAEIELNMLVEVGRGAEGKLAGTIDIPTQKMQYYLLTTVTQEGRQVTLDFFRDSEKTKNARFLFEGEMSEDGQTIEGTFTGWYDDEGRNKVPFVLHRTAGAFEPRPEVTPPALHGLSADSRELEAAFNGDGDDVRLLILVSPTCGVCLASAQIVQKYVLDEIDSDRLQLYVVWGPMLGGEQREDAEKATVFLPDPRTRHFWTPEHQLAEALQAPLGLENERAWDTFLLYPPGIRWQQGPPAPASYMHVGRSLPKERRFNGEGLAAEIRQLLAAPAPSEPLAAAD